MRKDSDNAKLLEPGELPSKRKVLVVEDNELNRDILSSFLEEKFDVFLAENGEEGLELLSEHYRELSVVLLDICMPVCDGFELDVYKRQASGSNRSGSGTVVRRDKDNTGGVS